MAVIPILAACQGGGATTAAGPAYTLDPAPVEDYCSAREQGPMLVADPTNYRALIAKLAAGQTLLLSPGRYPVW